MPVSMATVSFSVMFAIVIFAVLGSFADNTGRAIRAKVSDVDLDGLWRIAADDQQRDDIARVVNSEAASVAPSILQAVNFYTILFRGTDTATTGDSGTSDLVSTQREIRSENQNAWNDVWDAPKGSWRKNVMRVWG